MNVFVNVKSIGKRRPVLEKVGYELSESISTLRELVIEFVKIEVEKYNSQAVDVQLLPFITEQETADMSAVGKVSFGNKYNEKKANSEKYVEVALQGFEDGLFKVLVGDTEIKTLDSTVNLKENDVLTFIRLTFLAGRRW